MRTQTIRCDYCDKVLSDAWLTAHIEDVCLDVAYNSQTGEHVCRNVSRIAVNKINLKLEFCGWGCLAAYTHAKRADECIPADYLRREEPA